MVVIYGGVWRRLANLPSEGDSPYPIMVFAAMLPWQFFASSLSECSNSFDQQCQYCCRRCIFLGWVVPTSAVVVSFVDFMISGIILLGLMAWYKLRAQLGGL